MVMAETPAKPAEPKTHALWAFLEIVDRPLLCAQKLAGKCKCWERREGLESDSGVCLLTWTASGLAPSVVGRGSWPLVSGPPLRGSGSMGGSQSSPSGWQGDRAE